LRPRPCPSSHRRLPRVPPLRRPPRPRRHARRYPRCRRRRLPRVRAARRRPRTPVPRPARTPRRTRADPPAAEGRRAACTPHDENADPTNRSAFSRRNPRLLAGWEPSSAPRSEASLQRRRLPVDQALIVQIEPALLRLDGDARVRVLSLEELVHESADRLLLTLRRLTVAMVPGEVEADVVLDAQGLEDLFRSHQRLVAGLVSQPLVSRVPERDDRSGRDHRDELVMIVWQAVWFQVIHAGHVP